MALLSSRFVNKYCKTFAAGIVLFMIITAIMISNTDGPVNTLEPEKYTSASVVSHQPKLSGLPNISLARARYDNQRMVFYI